MNSPIRPLLFFIAIGVIATGFIATTRVWGVSAADQYDEWAKEGKIIPGELVVKTKSGAEEQQLSSGIIAEQEQKTSVDDAVCAFSKVTLDKGISIDEAIKEIKKLP